MDSRTALSELSPGQEGIIASVDGADGLRKRLQALGFRAGRAVMVLRRASLRGPLHVRLGTTDVALRPVDAGSVLLRAVKEFAPRGA